MGTEVRNVNQLQYFLIYKMVSGKNKIKGRALFKSFYIG